MGFRKYVGICYLLLLASTTFAGGYHPTIQYIFPLPGSKMLPPAVTVILRLHPEFNRQISNLPELIQVFSNNETCAGTIFFATDQRTIIFRPKQKFTEGNTIHVTIQASQFNQDDFHFKFTIVANQPLASSTDFTEEADHRPRDSGPDKINPVHVLNGVAVPKDFPRITTRQFGATAPGMIFYGTNFPEPGTGNYLIICKNDGTPYFYRKYPEMINSLDFTLQPKGVLTAYFSGLSKFVVLDSHFVEIDTISCGHGYQTNNHELLLLENGHALLIAEEELFLDMSRIVVGGRESARVLGNHIQELDRNRNVIFEWRSWDHFQITDAIGISLKKASIDYAHINSIAVDDDSNLVISTRNLCEITKINRQSGEIIWRLGGNHNQFRILDETHNFAYQHDVRPVPDRPGNYTIFDNGRVKNRGSSRVVEYKIHPKSLTARKVWEFHYPAHRFIRSMGSAQRVPNGNTLIDGPGKEMYVCEVTSEGELVFEMRSEGHVNYRCRRFEWQGMLTTPYLIVENYGATVRLIFNKFGDPSVKYYKIYYGLDATATVLLDSTSATWYDISYLRNNTRYFFRVTAVNAQAQESGFSNTEKTLVQYIEGGRNLIKNGEFNSGQSWELVTSGHAAATGMVDSMGRYQISISEMGIDLENVRLQQENILLMEGREYLFEFDAFADTNCMIEAKLAGTAPRYPDYSQLGRTRLTRRPKHFQYAFKMRLPIDEMARLAFNCGLIEGNLYFDNIFLAYSDSSLYTMFDFVKINFQPPEQPVPNLYLKDAGERYQAHPNGFSYGWLGGPNAAAEIRESILDLRYISFNYLLKNDSARVWEIKVPNGTYAVHLVLGDPDSVNQINNMRLEDKLLNDPDGPDKFDEFTAQIKVTDGRLTISPADESANVKICFIDIFQPNTGIESTKAGSPQQFLLQQNFPNPFNRHTTIEFSISRRVVVQIQIFNILGHLTRTLLNRQLNPGQYSIVWNGCDNSGSSVASGIYFYTIRAGEFSAVKKMVLIN